MKSPGYRVPTAVGDAPDQSGFGGRQVVEEQSAEMTEDRV
jgi:hypothetical protein